MICFKDMTFCASKAHHLGCTRQWTTELQAEADKWWGKPGAPVAFSYFCSPKEEEATHGQET